MKITKTIFFAFFLTLITSVNYAQSGNSNGPGQPTTNGSLDPPPDIPIDQNLIILAGCAILFGIYSVYRYNEKKASI